MSQNRKRVESKNVKNSDPFGNALYECSEMSGSARWWVNSLGKERIYVMGYLLNEARRQDYGYQEVVRIA